MESSDIGHDEPQVDQDKDFGWIRDSVEPQINKIIHRSWDTFGDATTEEPCSAYISDGYPQAFDAALRLESRNISRQDAPSNVVPYEVLITVCYRMSPYYDPWAEWASSACSTLRRATALYSSATRVIMEASNRQL